MPMDSHERSAATARVAAIDQAIEKLPTGIPDPAIIERWRKLLEEKEQLETMLLRDG
jgi:hypothetical protein